MLSIFKTNKFKCKDDCCPCQFIRKNDETSYRSAAERWINDFYRINTATVSLLDMPACIRHSYENSCNKLRNNKYLTEAVEKEILAHNDSYRLLDELVFDIIELLRKYRFEIKSAINNNNNKLEKEILSINDENEKINSINQEELDTEIITLKNKLDKLLYEEIFKINHKTLGELHQIDDDSYKSKIGFLTPSFGQGITSATLIIINAYCYKYIFDFELKEIISADNDPFLSRYIPKLLSLGLGLTSINELLIDVGTINICNHKEKRYEIKINRNSVINSI